MAARTIRWGIVGFGNLAQRKLGPAFAGLETASLTGLTRTTETNLDAVADCADIRTTSPEALISHPDIDAVWICTPPHTHVHLAQLVAQAGKPCIVEKPAGRSGTECAAMVSAFEASGAPLFISYYRRYHPRYLRIKSVLDAGSIGSVYSVHYRFRGAAPLAGWRLVPGFSGGGYFQDIGCHVLDLLDFWFGALQIEGAVANNFSRNHNTEDSVALTFSTQSGTTGSLNFTRLDGGFTDEMVIEGSTGRLRFACMDTNAPVRLESTKPPAPIRRSLPTRILNRLGLQSKPVNQGTTLLDFEPPRFAHQPMIETVSMQIIAGQQTGNAESALRTARALDVALAPIYGDRSEAFWKRPRSWQSAAHKDGRQSKPLITAEEKAQFETNGYIGPFPLEASLLSAVKVSPHATTQSHLTDASVFDICAESSVVQRANELLGNTGAMLFKTRFWVKQGGSELEVPWHQDVGVNNGGYDAGGNPVPTVTVWLALDDAMEGSGALKVIPGSHRTLLGCWRENINANLSEADLEQIDMRNQRVLEARRGEFYIFHSWILHGSDKNLSPSRRAALNMRYVAAGNEAETQYHYVCVG